MEVANFIREYLFKQDYLDVPELGTFFLSKDPFSLEGSQKIKPSSKILIFRENDRITSDLLIHFIARRKQISIEESKNLVSQFTLEIRNLIKRRGTADIAGFGKFTSEDGFHLEFKAHPANYSPISFGLGELNLPPLEKKQENPTGSEKSGVFSDYKPFSGSLSSDSKPGPTLNEIYFNKSILENKPSGEITNDSFNPLINQSNHPEPSIHTSNSPIDSSASTQKEKEDQTIKKDDLPTAEEIYKAHGFHPDHSVLEEQPSTENPIVENSIHSPYSSTSLSSEPTYFPEVPYKSGEDADSLVLDHGMTQTEPIQSIDEPGSFPATPSEENKIQNINSVVNNPLYYSDSSLGFNSNSEFSSSGSFQSKPYSAIDEKALESEYEAPRSNFSWVWILTSLILLATLASLAYLERARIQKLLPSLIPVAKTATSIDSIRLVQTQDSLQKTLTKTSTEDSIQKTGASNSGSSQPLLPSEKSPNIPADSSQKNIQPTKNPLPGKELGESQPNNTNLSGDVVKLVKDAEPFLIISSSFHLKLTAKKQILTLNKKGFNSFIVEMSQKGLFPFQVCLGEFKDRQSALNALNDILSKPEFKTGKKPYIFENKTKPSN